MNKTKKYQTAWKEFLTESNSSDSVNELFGFGQSKDSKRRAQMNRPDLSNYEVGPAAPGDQEVHEIVEYPKEAFVQLTTNLFRLWEEAGGPSDDETQAKLAAELEAMLNEQRFQVEGGTKIQEASISGDQSRYMLGGRYPIFVAADDTLIKTALLAIASESPQNLPQLQRILVELAFTSDSVQALINQIGQSRDQEVEPAPVDAGEEEEELPGTEEEEEGSPQGAGERDNVIVMWPRVRHAAREIMADTTSDYDQKKVHLVMQALSRLNKNPNIEFTWNAQIGEDMDVTAAYKLLANSKDATGIDQQFMKDVVQAIMDVSGVQIRDFNLQGNVMTKLGPGKAKSTAARPKEIGTNLPDKYPEAYDWWGSLPPDEKDRLHKLGDKGMIRAWRKARKPAPGQEVAPTDAEETPDAEQTDEYPGGQGPPEVMEPAPDEKAAEEKPEEAEVIEIDKYMVPTLSAFPRIKKAWRKSDPPSGATFAQDMAAFINFIGPFAAAAKESGVLKDPTMSENLIQQLVGRPGGKDKEPWRQSPFMRLGNRGAIGKEMAMKFNKLPSSKAGNGKRDRVERILNVVLGPGGANPNTKILRDEFLTLLGMVKPAEQKAKEEPQQKAAPAEEPRRRGSSFSSAAVDAQADRASSLARKNRASQGSLTEESAETLNESKTIDRWKTLAGIK